MRLRSPRGDAAPPLARPDEAPFVGREREMAAFAAVAASDHVTSVLGAPGMGKSRFAREWAAASLRDGAAGEVALVSLADGPAANEIGARLASALGAPAARDDVAGHVAALLATRDRPIVILDDADAALDAARELLAAVVPRAAGATWIVTSRARLGAPGERAFELGPLPPGGAGASALFVERARAVDPGVPLHEAVASRIAALLDGCPLALELAAARLRVFSAEELLGELEARRGAGAFALLPGLHHVIDSSYRALPEVAQRALACLAVIAEPFDRDAAAAVVGLPPDATLDVLALLRDRSLVRSRVDGEAGRRFFLFASIREHARAHLDASGERAVVQARHARHFRARARAAAAAGAPASREPIADLLLAHRHTSAAGEDPAERLRDALALDALLAGARPLRERKEVLDGAIAAAQRAGVGDALLAPALLARAEAQLVGGALAEGVADAEDALARARRSRAGSERDVARARAWLAVGRAFLGEPFGETELDESLAAHRATGDRVYEGRTLGWLGTVAMRRRDFDAAWSLLQRAALLNREAADLRFEGANLGNLASIAVERGRPKEARALLERALLLHERHGDERVAAICRGMMAMVAHDEGELEDARAGYVEALETLAAWGEKRIAAEVETRLGLACAELGRSAEAEAALTRAEAAAAATPNPTVLVLARGLRAVVEAKDGAIATAAHTMSTARALLDAHAEGPVARACLDVLDAHVALADDGGRRGSAADEHAAAVLARVAEAARESLDVRVAARWLERARAARDEAALVIDAAGDWFCPPRGGPVRFPLASMGRLLRRLVDQRLAAPGGLVDAEELIAAGWPGERIAARASRVRLHNALSRLRSIGLRDCLERSSGGYALRQDLRCRIAHEPPAEARGGAIVNHDLRRRS